MLELTQYQKNRLNKRWVSRFDQFKDVIVPDLPSIPGMISKNEMAYLYWLVSETYTGSGKIVELGSWLGKSTVAIACGLESSGIKEIVYTFDKYEWHGSFDSKSSLGLKHGSDFKHLFDANVQYYDEYIKSSKTNLRDIVWGNGSVEILFLDAPKRIKDIKSTFIEFGPWLIPNVSIIVLQDFGRFPSFEIAAFISFFQNNLDLIHAVERSSTVSFKVKDNNYFNYEKLQDFEFKNFSVNEVLQNWNNLLSKLPINTKERLEPGISMLLYDLGEEEKALEIIRKNKAKWGLHKQWGQLIDTIFYERYKILYDELGIRRPRLYILKSLFNLNKRTVLILKLKKQIKKILNRYLKLLLNKGQNYIIS
jgi:hypothetical protein